ncbi:MAG: hypothetical protein QM676_09365 [Novosphingobium sp.]
MIVSSTVMPGAGAGLPDSEPTLLRLASAYLRKYPRTERPRGF